MKRLLVAGLVVFGLGVTLVATEQSDAHAQAKKGAKASKKPAKKGDKEKDPEKDSEKGDGEDDEKDTAAGTGEGKVKGADSKTDKSGAPKVVETKGGGDGGVKTYTFGPVEVEGRLKSPQVIYFLRRVRAEFAAGVLGPPSFMRKRTPPRRNPALR